jgi:hypothetical protein
MLRAFVDDSGSGGESPWYVLAGYIGTAQGWESFDGLWRSVLSCPPALKYFKSSEAESLRPEGQWSGVTKEERNARIDDFISVIGRCALRAMSVRVRQADYNELIKPYVPECWDNAYYHLFTGIIAAATRPAAAAGARTLSSLFEYRHRQGEADGKAHRNSRRTARRRRGAAGCARRSPEVRCPGRDGS